MKSGHRLLIRCGVLLAAGAAVLWPTLGPSPTRADAVSSVSTTPADASTVATSPAQITVTFDQPIASAVTMVITCNGTALSPAPTPRVSGDKLTLIDDIPASAPLPKGQCSVFWSVQGATDGVTAFQTFTFKIQEDTLTATAVTTATTPTASASDGLAGGGTDLAGPLGLFRLVSTTAIASLFGALVLITVAWPEGIEYILTIRFLRYAWLLALVSTGLMVACLVAQITGKGFTSSILPTNWKPLTDSTPGIAALARVLLVAAAGWVAMRPERVIDAATQLVALAIPGVAVATLGFSRTGGDLELIGYVAGVAHVVAMAVWLGGLVLLARVVLAGPGEDDLVHAVRGFSGLATKSMIVTIVTGAVQLYRLDRGHLFDTTHGRLLLLKVVPVIAMVFVGVATRQFVHARLARAESMSAPLAGRLRRAVGMEAVIGVIVLAITSWMLSTEPGNLVAAGRSSSDFSFQLPLPDTTGAFSSKVSVDPAKVGAANEVLIEVSKPPGITAMTVRFDPPQNTLGHPVLMTITELTRGVTGWYLPPSAGIPLDVPGGWTVTIDVTTATGTFHEGGLMNVAPGSGSTSTNTIASVSLPPVTAAPLTVDPNAASTTTVAAGAG
ncbi:MAG: putative copper resistance protein [Ilumatobacteraceae bacterium]|nr:putative copper resistance protein [Ilumatobacteraceae bacterium]